jgi:hypothetical protein
MYLTSSGKSTKHSVVYIIQDNIGAGICAAGQPYIMMFLAVAIVSSAETQTNTTYPKNAIITDIPTIILGTAHRMGQHECKHSKDSQKTVHSSERW